MDRSRITGTDPYSLHLQSYSRESLRVGGLPQEVHGMFADTCDEKALSVPVESTEVTT